LPVTLATWKAVISQLKASLGKKFLRLLPSPYHPMTGYGFVHLLSQFHGETQLGRLWSRLARAWNETLCQK
jgi:hypothetical protein